MKLYRVTCRGMTGTMTRPTHGIAYVVAGDPTEAYSKVRKVLDKENLGFRHERELDRIELIAEDDPFPDCGFRLYL